MTSTASFLSDLANTFNLCVVVVNQMTTKFGAKTNNNNSLGSKTVDSQNEIVSSNFAPALGESWAHATSTRILLMFDKSGNQCTDGEKYGIQGQRRICQLVKSSHKATGMAYFSVTEFGLRDCVL